MRHRASRPGSDFWRHRVPRAAAIRIEDAASRLPVRSLGVATLTLSLGIGAYAAFAPAMDRPSDRATEAAAPPTSGEAARAPLHLSSPDGPTTEPDAPDAEPPRSGQPRTSSSTSEAIPPSQSTSDEPAGSPSTPGPPPFTGRTRPDATSSQPGDTTPPDTSLSERFPAPDAALFSFSADEAASFTCSLDGAAYSPCGSPAAYANLDAGWHTFSVRAVDAAGNTDPSPATSRWLAKNPHKSDP